MSFPWLMITIISHSINHQIIINPSLMKTRRQPIIPVNHEVCETSAIYHISWVVGPCIINQMSDGPLYYTSDEWWALYYTSDEWWIPLLYIIWVMDPCIIDQMSSVSMYYTSDEWWALYYTSYEWWTPVLYISWMVGPVLYIIWVMYPCIIHQMSGGPL